MLASRTGDIFLCHETALASQFAIAARQYAESAAVLATLERSGIDFTRLRDQTIEAQAHSEAAFKAFAEHVASHECDNATQNAQEYPCEQEKDVP
jgi:hypothetical protein